MCKHECMHIGMGVCVGLFFVLVRITARRCIAVCWNTDAPAHVSHMLHKTCTQVLSEEEAERAQSGLEALGVFLDTLLMVTSAQKARHANAGTGAKDQSTVESKVSLHRRLAVPKAYLCPFLF